MDQWLKTQVAVNYKADLGKLINDAGVVCHIENVAQLERYAHFERVYSATLMVVDLGLITSGPLRYADVDPVLEYLLLSFATFRELLAFAKARPEEPQDLPIFAGGKPLGGLLVPFIEKKRGIRHVNLVEIAKMKSNEWKCLFRHWHEADSSRRTDN